MHSISTSRDDKEANSSSGSQILDSCKIATSTTGINLEVALEIDHEDLYADITSAP